MAFRSPTIPKRTVGRWSKRSLCGQERKRCLLEGCHGTRVVPPQREGLWLAHIHSLRMRWANFRSTCSTCPSSTTAGCIRCFWSSTLGLHRSVRLGRSRLLKSSRASAHSTAAACVGPRLGRDQQASDRSADHCGTCHWRGYDGSSLKPQAACVRGIEPQEPYAYTNAVKNGASIFLAVRYFVF